MSDFATAWSDAESLPILLSALDDEEFVSQRMVCVVGPQTCDGIQPVIARLISHS